jgi:transcriptional regulator GlxA family with amidase domain
VPSEFTGRQKHALALIEQTRLSPEQAAREMGFKDPKGTGKKSFLALLARARAARHWRQAVVDSYLEP